METYSIVKMTNSGQGENGLKWPRTKCRNHTFNQAWLSCHEVFRNRKILRQQGISSKETFSLFSFFAFIFIVFQYWWQISLNPFTPRSVSLKVENRLKLHVPSVMQSKKHHNKKLLLDCFHQLGVGVSLKIYTIVQYLRE